MVRMRDATLVALLCARGAVAQTPPPPPPQPAPAPVPTAPATGAPTDPYAQQVLDEQIAEQLVDRAQELMEAKLYADAKQLAVEALVKSPKGNAADRARFIITTVNQYLHIKDDPPPTPPSDVKPDLAPIGDPARVEPPAPPLVETPPHDGRNAAMVHGALFGGLLGATVGAFIGGDNPAKVAVPVGIVTGVGSGLLARRLVRPLGWDEAQVRTAGSFNLWAGVAGGLFGDAVTGAGDGPASARGVLLGASIGGSVGLLAGGAIAHQHRLTRGDVALVDTLAGIGAAGGLTMGMLMQPAQKEAYSINSMLGIGGGMLIGYIAAPQTNTTPRRMLRVAGLAAAGGAVPFLLYAAIYDPYSSSDEQTVGALSTLGLLAGAYIGFRVTSGMDAGLDVQDGKRVKAPDAPVALFGRNSDGAWSLGGFGLQPLSKQLGALPGQRGATLTVLGGAF